MARKKHSFLSFLYHTTFYLFVLVIAVLLVASVAGLIVQAWLSGGNRRWNIFVVVAAYVIVAAIAIVHVWSRLLSINKTLRTMPKPYIPTKTIDVPKKVADHVAAEYSRTAVVAHISQATTGEQEGWGRPGTKWETVHFRTYILSTVATMRDMFAPVPSAPHDLAPLLAAASALDPGPLKVFVSSYLAIVERARYARREPTEVDAQAVERVVELVGRLVEVRKSEVAC
ncbi:hypothetical protein Q5752_004775 [Cryptotrichosporon argae]